MPSFTVAVDDCAIQDKLLQKQHLSGVSGVALGEYCDIPDTAALLAAGERWGYPIMLKTRKNAYDGRGNLPGAQRGGGGVGVHDLVQRRQGGALRGEVVRF